ncbi:MAG: hypothetical protein ACKO27_07100 [Ilumatobacteraceae bacterium]
MTEDDLPDLSFFRFERSLYDLTRPLDELDDPGTPAIDALSDDTHYDDAYSFEVSEDDDDDED